MEQDRNPANQGMRRQRHDLSSKVDPMEHTSMRTLFTARENPFFASCCCRFARLHTACREFHAKFHPLDHAKIYFPLTTRASPISQAVLIFYFIAILHSFQIALLASCEKVKDC